MRDHSRPCRQRLARGIRARQTGARKGILFTGPVVSETDLIRYQSLAKSGGSRFGGKVTQLGENTFRLDFEEFPDFIR